jgi:hypothetical protein
MNLGRISLLAGCCVLSGVHSPMLGQPDSRSAGCQHVMAKLETVRTSQNCTSPVAFCAAGVITGGGVVHGTTTGVVLGLVPAVGLPVIEPNSTLSYAAERTIQTARGMLTLRLTGVFDTVRGEFSELERVTGGTGIFEGARGTLWLIGTTSDGTTFQGDLIGEVCLVRR